MSWNLLRVRKGTFFSSRLWKSQDQMEFPSSIIEHCTIFRSGKIKLNNQDVYISKDPKHVPTQRVLQQKKWCRLPPSFESRNINQSEAHRWSIISMWSWWQDNLHLWSCCEKHAYWDPHRSQSIQLPLHLDCFALLPQLYSGILFVLSNRISNHNSEISTLHNVIPNSMSNRILAK